MDHIDLRKYLVTEENKTGRKRYDSEILLKVMNFEIAVISCGFNLHKYYLKQLSRRLAA